MPSFTGLRHRVWATWGRKPDKLYYANGGVGDELILTAVAAAARAANRPVHVIAAYPEVWRGNTDTASIETDLPRWLYAQRRGWVDTKVIHLAYVTGNGRSIAEQMAAHTGITLPDGWRPTLFGLSTIARDSRRIVLQNSCRGARYAATTKEWPQERWHRLAARLSPDFELLQVGTRSDPPVPGATDRRGGTSLRDAIELIASARGFVGLESGMMHVAAATRTPAVIIVGGRTRPQETCYPFNHNVTRAPDCVSCGRNDGCPHQVMCMDIPVDEVEAQVRHMMSEPPS